MIGDCNPIYVKNRDLTLGVVNLLSHLNLLESSLVSINLSKGRTVSPNPYSHSGISGVSTSCRSDGPNRFTSGRPPTLISFIPG